MRITQGTFSYLPDFTDEEVAAQVRYCLGNGWPVSIEYTDDPHPRNAYWEMWKLPMFDLNDCTAVMQEIKACRAEFPQHYIKVNGYDRTKGRQTTTLSFIVNRPDPNLVSSWSEPRVRTAASTTPSAPETGLPNSTASSGVGCQVRSARKPCQNSKPIASATR